MSTIAIMVQKYHKDQSNYVYCRNMSDSESNFILHRNYISKFSEPIKVGKAYLVDYTTEPSKCQEYMNHKINVISELTMKDVLSML